MNPIQLIKKYKKALFGFLIIFILILGFNYSFREFNFNTKQAVGNKIDSLNNIYVYYNGGVNNVVERNITENGYNLGLKYQCVEFVKRYYFEYYNHEMPDSYGHAKDFFNQELKDGELNKDRGLIQYENPSISKPVIGDLVVYSPTVLNRFGHVAIISNVLENEVEIIQQNPGPYGKSREKYKLTFADNKWKVENDRIFGWLRK